MPKSAALAPATVNFSEEARFSLPSLLTYADTPPPVWLPIASANSCTEPKVQERSEEHMSELQSRLHLVCRLLLEKKKKLSTRNGSEIKTKPATTRKMQKRIQ